MPPRKRRQRAGALNYLKRKDVVGGARGDGGAGAEVNVAESVGHGRLETEERVVVEEREEADAVSGGAREGRSGTLEETGEVVRDDDGRSGTLEETDEEARDDDGSGVQEREEAECGPSSEEAPAASDGALVLLENLSNCSSRVGFLETENSRKPCVEEQCHVLHILSGKTIKPGLQWLIPHGSDFREPPSLGGWIDDFASNEGEFSDSQQGHYTRSNTLMSNEEICEKARVYIRENAAPKGRPNLTAAAFCQWVNNDLLPNSTLEPGYPRRVSVETARKWLHDLGFDVQHMSKGVFIDGHERPDVQKAIFEENDGVWIPPSRQCPYRGSCSSTAS